ncbi:response regulator [Clostridium sp. PL3]|uniref:Transcriptional regulatory protein n=1 Tax=Clostridium thailandense TaxID=2794346 RepID=A0A949U060_9CLOT|nr:response regulator [Clostridium thailandense]MBV7276896.1 response regulator [Clostridium thailandense]
MIRVMIIEDDPMVLEINSKFLRKVEGFSLAKAATNLQDAKDFILKNKVDLILLDVYLPKENGMDFLKWLRQEDVLIDVILITADKTVDRVQEAFRFGAIDYLIKPFTFTRFKEALNLFKDRYANFKSQETIDQSQLDRMILNSTFTTEDKTDIPEKGFNKYTYKKIWNFIEKEHDDYFTAEDLSETLGVARVTIRKYLEYMEKEKKLEKLIEYGKIGRPQHKYRVNQNI